MSNSTKQGSKRPRRLVIGIYLDDEIGAAADVAEQAYEKVRLELERTRPRRLAEYAAAGLEPDAALERVQDEDRGGLVDLGIARQEALAALDEATCWFVFEALGHRRLAALIRRHPPTDTQQLDATGRGQELAWNPDTFLRALVEDSCVAPVGVDWDAVFGNDTDFHVDELPAKSAWSTADIEALAATAIAVNQSLRTAPKERQPSLRRLLGDPA